jgi:hypothetical protein
VISGASAIPPPQSFASRPSGCDLKRTCGRSRLLAIRAVPGLVVTIFNVHKPRDRYQYERFTRRSPQCGGWVAVLAEEACWACPTRPGRPITPARRAMEILNERATSRFPGFRSQPVQVHDGMTAAYPWQTPPQPVFGCQNVEGREPASDSYKGFRNNYAMDVSARPSSGLPKITGQCRE